MPQKIPTAALKRFAKGVVPNPLFVVLSGSHAYGFPSKDSDYDLRASHVVRTRELLGLHRPSQTIEREEKGEKFEIVSHEIGKLLGMLVSPSGYILEQIHSPYPIITTKHYDELKRLSKNAICKKVHAHYNGFAFQMWKLARQESYTNIKRNLYLLRVLMSGIHLLQTGKIEVNIHELNKRFGIPVVPELVEIKTESEAVRKEVNIEREVSQLFDQLEQAYKASPLPEDVQHKERFDGWLVKLRMGYLK